MLRFYAAAVLTLAFCAGGLVAEEIKGKVKEVNADKGKIVVTVGDKDQEFTVTDDTKVVNAAGKEMPGKLKAKVFEKPGAAVTIKTEKKDGKEVVTEVKVTPEIKPIIKPLPIKIKPVPIKPGILPVKPPVPPTDPVPPEKIG